jgi:uncharacterized protein (DUF2237 family)
MKAAMLFLGIFFITSTVFSQKKTAQENCIITNNKDLKVKKMETTQKNVLGTDLQLASKNPLTGFYRTGFCSTDEKDRGVHVVAAVVTDEFLNYSLSRGNDLISPYLASGFPGLKAGDIWCLCALRWKEALDAGVAPPVILEATNIKALQFISLEDLKNNQAK